MIRKGCFTKHVLVAFISEHNIYRPWLLKKNRTSGFQAMAGKTQVIDLGLIWMLWMLFKRWLSSLPEPWTMPAWWWHVAWPGRMDTWANTWASRETLWHYGIQKGGLLFLLSFCGGRWPGGVCIKLLGCTLLMVASFSYLVDKFSEVMMRDKPSTIALYTGVLEV